MSCSDRDFWEGGESFRQPLRGLMHAAIVLGACLLCAACSRTHSRMEQTSYDATARPLPAQSLDAGAHAKGGALAGGDGSTTPLSRDGVGAGGAGAGSGGAGSGSGGAGSGGAGTDGSMSSLWCSGPVTFDATLKMTSPTGSVLLMFDRTASMSADWNGMGPKWQVAGQAVIAALQPVQDSLTIGVLFFGGDPASACAVHPITDPGQIGFQPGAAALTAFQGPAPNRQPNPIYSPSQLSETPTAEAIAQADMALASATHAGMAVVILITDGEPSCSWNEPATVASVAKWQTQWAITTYVIGLPGISGNGPKLLDELAYTGGTGQRLTPVDAMTLQQNIHDIVRSTLKPGFDACSIDLMPPATSPDKLLLVVTEPSMPGMHEKVPHDLGNGAGWTITSDGSHVELLGALCDSTKAGRISTLVFQLGGDNCIPSIPPSHLM